MPSFNSKVQLSTSAKNSNTVLSDIDLIKGAFKVYTANDMNAAHVNYFTDGQIIYVSDSGSLYKANVTLADPGQGIFEDSVSFSEFSFDSGSFNSASFDGATSTLTLFGQSLVGSIQTSASIDLSSLSGGGSTPTLDQVVTQGSISTNAISASQFNFPENGGLFATIEGSNYSVVTLQDNAYYTNLLEVRGKEDGVGISNSGGLKFVQFYEPTSTNYEIKFAGRTGTGAFDSSATLKLIVSGALDVSGGITGSIATSSITNFDTEVSRSAAAAGFGTGGGGGGGSITGIFGGDGLGGGGSSGDQTLFVRTGDGLQIISDRVTLNTASQHFIDAVNELAGNASIFALTGSVYSTTNNIEVTGSLTVADGVFKLKEFTTTPTAEGGAMIYSASNFYFGID